MQNSINQTKHKPGGNSNTGNFNTGNFNTGHSNTGIGNTGNCNNGHNNTGDRNTGNCNTGHSNIGDCNTGNYNVGNYNTGNYNTGDYNTGSFNRTDHSTGFFCTKPEYPELFDIKYESLTISEIERALSSFFSTFAAVRPAIDEQGNFFPYSRESAQWGWNMLQEEDQEALLDLTAFNADKFLECTGIDVRLDCSLDIRHKPHVQAPVEDEGSGSNIGNDNIGNDNIGNGNVGHKNIGSNNDGDGNVANWNFGCNNAGNSNVGNSNVGNENEGRLNTGNFNIGNLNSGYRNVGDNNTGDHNNGIRNIGRWNKTNNCCGYFCTEPKTVRMFDADTGLSFEDANATIPDFLVGLMTLARDGDFIQKFYNERVSEEEKEKIKAMPNFDAKIFKKCTGIDV